MSPDGFKAFEVGLNFDQVKVVAKRIAQFHAASYYINDSVRYFPLEISDLLNYLFLFTAGQQSHRL